MIKILPISRENEQLFENKVTKMFKGWCKRNKNNHDFDPLFDFVYTDFARTTFNDENLKKIIVGKLDTLKEVIDEIGKIENGDLILNIYKNSFLQNDLSSKWAQLIGVRTCPYCNRNYTTTIQTKRIRPDFDHFLPKSKYPYLCVSMYNLIPCCKSCNNLKKDHDPILEPFIYPYEEEYGENVNFNVDFSGNITDLIDESKKLEVNIIHNCDASLESKVRSTNTILGIEDLYKTHNDYAKDILTLSRIYSDSFLGSLKETFPWMKSYSGESILKILFMNELMKDNWNKRPFSKFTFDIVKKYRR